MITLWEDHKYDLPDLAENQKDHENDNPKVYLVNWVIIDMYN